MAPADPTHGEGNASPTPEPLPSARARAGYVLVPLVLTVALWLLARALTLRETAYELLVAGAASVLGMGTSVILAPAVLDGFVFHHVTTWHLAVLVVYLNAAEAFFLAYNLDLLERVPWLGPRMARARRRGTRTLKERPWIRRWATFGVGFFVFLPLPGSSSLAGCVLGRLIGLTNLRAFLTVSLAGTVVSAIYGWFGTGLQRWSRAHEMGFATRLAIVTATIVALVLLLRWITRPRRRSSRAA